MMGKPPKSQFIWHGSNWQGIGVWEYPSDWKDKDKGKMKFPIFKGYRFGIFEIRVYNLMVDGRIFCTDCRWFDTKCFGFRCLYPLNLENGRTIKRPEDMNTDNNCKLFRKMTFWDFIFKIFKD
jgi:hypothetical protein